LNKKNPDNQKIKTEKTSEKTNELTTQKDSLTIFLEKFFELDLIPSQGIQLKFKNKKFFLEREEVSDIILILVNAYNKYVNVDSKLKLDGYDLLKRKMFHLLTAKINALKAEDNLKDLESFIRQYTLLSKQDFKMSEDLKVFEKCMKELKPDITFDEIYSLIKKHSKEDE
jgi:hypothetical protein